jgi:hypothetical protein
MVLAAADGTQPESPIWLFLTSFLLRNFLQLFDVRQKCL